MNNPLVSIIMPTKNSSKTIAMSLESIKKQSYKNIEVIIVDNNSVDNTKEIASIYGQVFNIGPERASQMNCGAKQAKGKYLFTVSSDTELSPKVVEECVVLAEQGYDAINVPEIGIGEGFWTNCRALELRCYIGDQYILSPWFFRADLFHKVGGFDESLYAGEDWDLTERMRKAGCRIGYINAPRKHHLGKMALWRVVKKKFYYGKSLRKFIRKNKDCAIKQVPFFRPAYYKNIHILLSDPIHALGLAIMKTLETIAVTSAIIIHKDRNAD